MEQKLRRLRKEQIQDIAQKYGGFDPYLTKEELIKWNIRNINYIDLKADVDNFLPIPKGKQIRYVQIPVIVPEVIPEVISEEVEVIPEEVESVNFRPYPYISPSHYRFSSVIEEEEYPEEDVDITEEDTEEFEEKDVIKIYSNHPAIKYGVIEEIKFCKDTPHQCDIKYSPSNANIYWKYDSYADKMVIITDINEILDKKKEIKHVNLVYVLIETNSMYLFETDDFIIQAL